MKVNRPGFLFALSILAFMSLVAYGWNSSGLASSNNIFRVGSEIIRYNGETSSSLGDMEDKTPEGPGVQTVVLAYTCVFENVLFDKIIPAFKEHWRAKTGREIRFVTAWSLPEFDTLATKAYDKPVQILLQTTNADPISRGYTFRSTLGTQARAFLVRKGNPKNIRTYYDLTRKGVDIVMTSPTGSSGFWHLLGAYGAFVKEAETVGGIKNDRLAVQNLRKMYRNLVASPAHGFFTTKVFNDGIGDVLVYQESKVKELVGKNPEKYDYVIPPYNGLYQVKSFTMGKNINDEDRPAIDEFINFLSSDQIQEVFAQAGWRPANADVLARHPEFAQLNHPWTVDYLGSLNEVKKTLVLERWAEIVNTEYDRVNHFNEYSN